MQLSWGHTEHAQDGFRGAFVGHLRFCEGSEFVHLWHAIKAHPWNSPREVGTLTTRTNPETDCGYRARAP